MRRLPALLLLTISMALGADMTLCVCDVAKPETIESKECSLCRVAESQPAEPPIFLMKDNDPTKPNRWLAIPRFHGKAGDPLSAMTSEQRLQIWTVAIEKAKALWGNDWALAMNGIKSRSQCHSHVHIGKLLPGFDDEGFVVVDGAAGIPVPEDLSGILVHPVDGKLHVHVGPANPEPALLR